MQADMHHLAYLRLRLDAFSREESPAVASSCLRSFQVVSGFARAAWRESLEAVRVADVGAAGGATGRHGEDDLKSGTRESLVKALH